MKMEEETGFSALLAGLDRDPRALRMKRYVQHGSISTYDHCLRVARLSYAIARRLPVSVEERSLVRAAFLHDYFLYDWHTKGDHLHGYHHAAIAAENAERDFGLSEKEMHTIAFNLASSLRIDIKFGIRFAISEGETDSFFGKCLEITIPNEDVFNVMGFLKSEFVFGRLIIIFPSNRIG